MKPARNHLLFIPLILLVSCSPYQMVSLYTFREYEISPDEMRNLSFVLKKRHLHYSDTDRRYIINNYYAIDSEAYASQEMELVDHIVIPSGAHGICIQADSMNFTIDFGKGIQVPFVVSDHANRPKKEFKVGERVYHLSDGHQKARLYFDPNRSRR